MADEEKKDHNGWTETKEGWVKTGKGKGSADYFNKPLPPVRDNANRPLKPDGTGVDWEKLDQEING